MYLSHHFLIVQLLVIGFSQCGQAWSRSNSEQTGKLKDLDVICGKDHMTVRAEFDGPFNGIVSSKGASGQGNCVYIKSHSNLQHATFKVNYNECGTKPDLQGRYYENTIVIQYGTDIIEAMDEAKRLRCEWFEAYEKPATFRPAIPVADLDVVEMNFQGDDIDCWMEIQEGKGPWSRPISRIVPVGSLMTIVIAIADQSSQFDMRVKSCFAHDGVKPPVQLTDEYGCVLRKSMLSEFSKIRGPDFRKNLGENAAVLNGYLGKATVISYAHFYAFKFPDSMSVQMQCTVEVCRNGCPAACDSSGYPPPNAILKPKISFNQAPNRKNENNNQPPQNQRGNTRRQQNYDHSHDIVLDDDVALTAAESNHQPAAVLPLELQNHRRALEEDGAEHKNSHNQVSNPVGHPAAGASENGNGNDIKLNNEQILLITTTPRPISYKLNEDALQHENSKLINELKQFAGMDLHRLTEGLLNVKQASSAGQLNHLNHLNGLLMSKPTDPVILDSLPSLTSHIQQLQNDHLEKVFQNERLRELALESGLKLNQINEFLPQAQPLMAIGGKTTTNDNSTIDFDSLLNSVNNLISSGSQSVSSTAAPAFQAVSTTTSTQSPVTENKDLYLEEEPDDLSVPTLANADEGANDVSLKQAEAQDKNADQSRVNVRVLNHQLRDNDNNQFKHEPLPKNQPSYIIETSPNKPAPLGQPLSSVQSKPLALPSNSVPAGMAPLEPQSLPNKSPPPPPQFHPQQSSNNKQQPSINYFYQNGHLMPSPNLIQPLMNHQHHQPLHFQYLPFNGLPVNSLNSLPMNLNSFNSLSSLNGLPMNLLANPQTPVVTKPPKQISKLANLLKQNSLTQYGYSLLQSFTKKDKNQPANDPANAGLLSLFPAGTRALRVGRNVRMQIPNKLGRIKLKRENGDASKVRTRRSIGSHVSVKQEFQVVTPLDMQFGDYDEEQELGQPELLQGRSDLQVKEAKSLICIQFKSTLMIASVLALVLFALSVLACILLFKRYKKLEN